MTAFDKCVDGEVLEHLAWLAWEASRKEGRAVPLFDKFVDNLVDLDLENGDAPLVDTA